MPPVDIVYRMALEGILGNLAVSLPKHRKKFIFALLGGLLSAYYYNRNNKKLQKECPPTDKTENTTSSREAKVGVNLAFVQQLKKLLPICIPGMIEY